MFFNYKKTGKVNNNVKVTDGTQVLIGISKLDVF